MEKMLSAEAGVGLFATFGGQGYPYLSEAQALYATEVGKAFMEPIVQALEAVAGTEEVRESHGRYSYSRVWVV